MKTYNPLDWYWAVPNGDSEPTQVFSSARSEKVSVDDEAYAAWRGLGGVASNWPKDDSGNATDAALSDVLSPYGLSVPGVTVVPTSVSSAQAKIQLFRTPGSAGGKTLLNDVSAAVQAAGGEVAIWFSDARIWERSNPHVTDIATTLKLSESDVDDLFISAAKIVA